ncbi:MAG: hypothetical protein IEMM0008_0057 [bacterium]|nr:MAG: hypothetical protein IEMM0008_0057 [bacterium]
MAFFKGSLKRVEILSKLSLILISITLSVFLILLSENFMSDISGWFDKPIKENFQDKIKLDKVNEEVTAIGKKLKKANEKASNLSSSLNVAHRNYNSEKKSFETWIKARTTIGSPDEDSTVRDRGKKLDKLRAIEDAWQTKIDVAKKASSKLLTHQRGIISKRSRIRAEGNNKYWEARRTFTIKIFFVRLAIILPIMILAFILLVKFKTSKFKSLIWGYAIYAVYAFFFGLVPYLPSFGGYIRYAIGALLTLFIGYYTIKRLTVFTARKKAELEESREGRLNKIKHETAIKAYKSHSCPSCERDFLSNKWSPKSKKLLTPVLEEEAPSFCHHCGLILFDKCPKCSHRNFIHFPYCSNCGETLNT